MNTSSTARLQNDLKKGAKRNQKHGAADRRHVKCDGWRFQGRRGCAVSLRTLDSWHRGQENKHMEMFTEKTWADLSLEIRTVTELLWSDLICSRLGSHHPPHPPPTRRSFEPSNFLCASRASTTHYLTTLSGAPALLPETAK